VYSRVWVFFTSKFTKAESVQRKIIFLDVTFLFFYRRNKSNLIAFFLVTFLLSN
jgi:hypothetical protein